MELSKSVKTACALACLPLLGAPGCDPYMFSWQGPTPYFKNILDQNKDGLVSRLEWQFRTPETNVFSGGFSQYERNDCDRDGNLSWNEYFHGFMKHKRCRNGEEGGVYPYLEASTRYHTSYVPRLMTSKEAARFADAKYSSRHLPFVEYAEGIAHGVSERSLSASELESISSTCDEAEELPIHSNLYIFQAGNFPSISCRIENDNAAVAINFIAVESEANYSGSPETTWHGKAVAIMPNSSETIVLVYPPDVAPLSMEVALVRGVDISPLE